MSGQAQDTRPPVSENLRRFQELAGLSNNELAGRLGHRDDRQITRWRSGEVTPSWSALVALGRALGVAPTDFYAGPPRAAA